MAMGLVVGLASAAVVAEGPAARDEVTRTAERVLAAMEAEAPAPADAQPGGGGGAEAAPDDEDAGELVITGKPAPVEQGERSHLSALPPRDLRLRPLSESPGLDTATSIVGADQIAWQESYSIVDALKYVPGAWTESRGRKVKEFFSVRGQTYPYPEFMVDGAYFREFHETDYFLPANMFERIEVLRSSAVLLHGPGGMNGMVNLVPKRFTEPEGTLTQHYGSDNLTRTEVTYGEGGEDYSYSIAAGFRHTDGDKEMNAEENIANIYTNLQYDVSDDLTLSMTHAAFFGKRELEKGEGDIQQQFLTREDMYDPMRTYVFVGKAHYHPNDRMWTEVTGNYGIRRFFGHRDQQFDWLEEDYEYGARVVQGLRLCDANTLRFGTTFNRWRTPTGKRFYGPTPNAAGNPADISTWTAFVIDEHQFDRLTVNTGYRMTWEYIKRFGGFGVEGSGAGGLRNVRIEDDHADPLGTYTLGGVYALDPEWSVHGNFTWGEIASRPGMFTLAGERPDTETRFKYDVGLKRAWDDFGEIMGTFFYVDQQNAALGANQTVLVNGERVQVFTSGDRESYGVELDARSKRFDCGTQFFANATLMTAREERGGDWQNDQEVPNLVVGGGVSQMFGDAWEFSVFVKRVGDYENERFTPDNVPDPLGDFTDVTTKVTYYFGDQKQHRAFFMVNNVGGQHYETVNGWPNEGVQYVGGVTLAW